MNLKKLYVERKKLNIEISEKTKVFESLTNQLSDLKKKYDSEKSDTNSVSHIKNIIKKLENENNNLIEKLEIIKKTNIQKCIH